MAGWLTLMVVIAVAGREAARELSVFQIMLLRSTLGIAMLIGRFLIIVPLLAAAGSLASKRKVPSSAGTFPTHGPLFVTLIAGTVVIVGALTFFPVLSLGPIVEHFLMHQVRVF